MGCEKYSGDEGTQGTCNATLVLLLHSSASHGEGEVSGEALSHSGEHAISQAGDDARRCRAPVESAQGSVDDGAGALQPADRCRLAPEHIEELGAGSSRAKREHTKAG